MRRRTSHTSHTSRVIVGSLAIVVLLAALLLTAVVNAASVTMTIEDVKGEKGKEVEVPIVLEDPSET